MTAACFYHPSWPVLYEDNHLLVLYKPAGLLVQGDQTRDVSLLELAKAWLKARYHKPGEVFLGMVHRLDRPVAGVLLFCRTSKAAARVSEQFRQGTTEKRYLAIVEGALEPASGRLVHQIERRDDRSSRIVASPTASSQEARLRFERLDRAPGYSLVAVTLETGRRHQIRLQLAHLGHPILGDLRYGACRPLPQRQLALFAHRLTITHPTRGERITFESPLPHGWPWPPDAPATGGPPWDWHELEPLIGSLEGATGPCPLPRSVEE